MPGSRLSICFATNNAHKLDEVRQKVSSLNIGIISLSDIGCADELPETQDTIPGNSLQKAEYVFSHYRVACFADDTGLEVDALNGAPGVYSARYAGPQRDSRDNTALLLKNLEGMENRGAQFRTVITLVGLEREPVAFEGIVRGTIAESPRGNGGFGYDPVFVPLGHDRTFAEMTLEEKNQMSHRAIAVAKLVEFLSRSGRQDSLT